MSAAVIEDSKKPSRLVSDSFRRWSVYVQSDTHQSGKVRADGQETYHDTPDGDVERGKLGDRQLLLSNGHGVGTCEVSKVWRIRHALLISMLTEDTTQPRVLVDGDVPVLAETHDGSITHRHLVEILQSIHEHHEGQDERVCPPLDGPVGSRRDFKHGEVIGLVLFQIVVISVVDMSDLVLLVIISSGHGRSREGG